MKQDEKDSEMRLWLWREVGVKDFIGYRWGSIYDLINDKSWW